METKVKSTKAYLGDSVFADWSRGEIVLTVEHNGEVLNRIYLASEVWKALSQYVLAMKRNVKF